MDSIGEINDSTDSDVLRVFQSKEETRSFYNKIARVYDLLSERSEQPMRDIGLAMLSPKEGETVLEIGFGTGHCLVLLAEAVGPTGKVLGIDLSENMVSEAKRRVAKKQLDKRVEISNGDAATLPYEDGSIDAIFSSFTLELFDTPELPDVLSEWKRVLRPGGRIVIVSLSKEEKSNTVAKAFEWTHKHFPNLMDCRPIHVENSLKRAGFKIEKSLHEKMWVPVAIVMGIRE